MPTPRSFTPDAITPVQVTHHMIDPWVKLIESAYRGESSRAGWTTEADLLGGQRLDADMAAEVLAQPDTAVFAVPTSAEVVAGFDASVQVVRSGPREAYVGMFAVAPTQQGSGLGSALLTWAEDWARTQWQAERARMTVIRQRAELIDFYGRRGYHPTGETEPFPYGDERFGRPLREDLEFVVLAKAL